MKRLHAIVLIVAVVGGVAAARVLLRDDGLPGAVQRPGSEQKAEATGRTVPLDLAPLPPTLQAGGEMRCAELRNENGTFTARAEGGTIRNTSGGALTYGFVFTVSAGAKSESVQSRFRLNAGQGVPTVTMASKSLEAAVTRCALRFFAAEVTDADVDRVNAAAKVAGCGSVARLESQGNDHIQPPERGSYADAPPTSGSHYPAPAGTGIHTDPIPNETQVHNLEHGHVGLQYRDVPPTARRALEAVASADPAWVFVAPYRSMTAAVTMTAWTVSLECATVPSDPAALERLAETFAVVFRDHAPESIPGTPG